MPDAILVTLECLVGAGGLTAAGFVLIKRKRYRLFYHLSCALFFAAIALTYGIYYNNRYNCSFPGEKNTAGYLTSFMAIILLETGLLVAILSVLNFFRRENLKTELLSILMLTLCLAVAGFIFFY